MSKAKNAFNTTSKHDAAITKGLSDDQLLDLVQRQTLRYFWDFAHPVSGMARERSNQVYNYDATHTVTSGGTGFGIMALVAGAERGFLPRKQVVKHLNKMTDFLLQAETHHGAFPHFLDGRTGKSMAFSAHDDGGDIVETAYLMMGLLTARQYFGGKDKASTELRAKIYTLWENVEWDWYTRGENQLFWHWSPKYNWGMNHP
ncbi:MAG: beta-glucosidase, partial [Alphaproteobacteria bacterium]|nr:beta-glucosidase [Alphaproteobacteria bacterium]